MSFLFSLNIQFGPGGGQPLYISYANELIDNGIVAYAKDYSGRKEKFNSFKEAVNNFKIYTEPLMTQIDKIIIINKGDD